MLLLSRRPGECVMIGDNINVKVLKFKGNEVVLGFDAPKEVKILRDDVGRKRTSADPFILSPIK